MLRAAKKGTKRVPKQANMTSRNRTQFHEIPAKPQVPKTSEATHKPTGQEPEGCDRATFYNSDRSAARRTAGQAAGAHPRRCCNADVVLVVPLARRKRAVGRELARLPLSAGTHGSTRRAGPRPTLVPGAMHKRRHPPGAGGSERRIHTRTHKRASPTRRGKSDTGRAFGRTAPTSSIGPRSALCLMEPTPHTGGRGWSCPQAVP